MLSCSPVRSRVVEGLSPAALWWKTTLPVLGIRNWNFAVCRWRCTCHSAGTWKDLGGRNELFLLCNCVRLQGVWRTLKLDLRTLPAFQNVKLWFSFVFSTLILFSLPNWKWISLLLFTALMRLANRKDRKYCSKSSASYVTMLARDIRSRCDGGVAIEAILTNILLLFFFCCEQMAAERQSDRIASDMEVCIKQRCGTEFLHAEKNGTHWHSWTLAGHLWEWNSECAHSGSWTVFYICCSFHWNKWGITFGVIYSIISVVFSLM